MNFRSESTLYLMKCTGKNKFGILVSLQQEEQGHLEQVFFFHFLEETRVRKKKTQVLAIFGKIQPIFSKTQVNFIQKSLDLLNRDSQKLRFPGFAKSAKTEKVKDHIARSVHGLKISFSL